MGELLRFVNAKNTPWEALHESSGQAGAADRDGMQGANRSHSRSYGEDLQRGRPPESADARGAVIRGELS